MSLNFYRLSESHAEEPIPLKKTETWPESFHLFAKRDLEAIDAARAAKRPLLVTGEPGTGKSQLARAAAALLECKFISKVIDAKTDIEDLWFRYDAVMRLGEAQILGAAGATNVNEKLKPARFIIPGPMWWAFDWADAADHCKKFGLSERGYATPNALLSSQERTVLLLDEIDKADADLANSLLEVLANGAFRVDLLGKNVGSQTLDATCELIVITSNNEKQLPAAFLRRCVVLKLSLPTDEAGFVSLLVERGRKHHEMADPPFEFDTSVLEEAAKQLFEDRRATPGIPKPGQAEYLDMLNVLKLNAKTTEEKQALLKTTREYIFQKYRGRKNRNDTEV